MKRQLACLILFCMAIGAPWSQAQAPATTTIVEGLFGSKKGPEKKESALNFVAAALSLSEHVLQKDIVDDEQFRDGLGKIIDGVVDCLNASAWAKKA